MASVVWRLSGAVSKTGLTVSCKTTGAASVSVLLSTSPVLAGTPLRSTAATPGTYGESKHVFTGLTPSTRYWYAVETDGVLDGAHQPASTWTRGAESFRFCAAGCADTASNDPVFAAIAAENPQIFLHMGDAQYRNEISTDPTLWASYYDDWLSRSNQATLWSKCPINYIESDHDSGPNSHYFGMARGFDGWAGMYRRYIPHHPLPSRNGVAIQHTWLLDDDIQVISTDTRAYRYDPAGVDNQFKTMLGPEQKQWFFKTLLEAKAASRVILWQQEVPWQGSATTLVDSWRAYTYERQEIADFLTAHGLNDQLYMIASDMHAVGWVAAEDNPVGHFPIAHVGPMSKTSGTLDEGIFTVGPFPGAGTGNGATFYHQYGIFDVTKTDDGISFAFTAKNGAGDVLIPTQTVTFAKETYVTAPANQQTALLSDLNAVDSRLTNVEQQSPAAFRRCRGTVTLTPVANVAKIVDVTFPVGTFTRAPYVETNIQSTSVAAQYARAVNITKDGFQLAFQRTNTTPTLIDWSAWDDPTRAVDNITAV